MARAWLVLALVSLLAASVAGLASGGALDDLLFEFQVVPLERRPAPAFSLPSLEGRTVTLAALRGRAVMLYFWQST